MSELTFLDTLSGGVTRVSAEQFFSQKPELTTLLTVVEFGGFTQNAKKHPREASERVRLVGRHLGGLFTPEDEDYNIRQGTAEHVDGVVDPYWQINAACLKEKKLRDELGPKIPTEITLRRRQLPNDMVIADVFPPEPAHGLSREFKHSILVRAIEKAQDRTTIEGKLYPLPLVTVGELTCKIPLGEVAVFANGTGKGNTFLSHETRTLLRLEDGSEQVTNTIDRSIAIGRVTRLFLTN